MTNIMPRQIMFAPRAASPVWPTCNNTKLDIYRYIDSMLINLIHCIKKIGCFNHRVITPVAVKLWVLETNWIRQPEKQVT